MYFRISAGIRFLTVVFLHFTNFLPYSFYLGNYRVNLATFLFIEKTSSNYSPMESVILDITKYFQIHRCSRHASFLRASSYSRILRHVKKVSIVRKNRAQQRFKIEFDQTIYIFGLEFIKYGHEDKYSGELYGPTHGCKLMQISFRQNIVQDLPPAFPPPRKKKERKKKNSH